MPILKSAIKKLKQSKVHAEENRRVREGVRDLVSKFRKVPKAANFAKVVSALDKAAKTNVIHKNKASRLKSRLAHLIASK